LSLVCLLIVMEEWPPKRGRKPTKWSDRPHNSRETATTADLRKLEKKIGDVLAQWEKEAIAEIDTLDLVVGFRTITGETREATATKKRKERPEWHTSRKKPTATAEETAVACLGGLSMPPHHNPPRPATSSTAPAFPSSAYSSFSPFSSFPAFPPTPYPTPPVAAAAAAAATAPVNPSLNNPAGAVVEGVSPAPSSSSPAPAANGVQENPAKRRRVEEGAENGSSSSSSSSTPTATPHTPAIATSLAFFQQHYKAPPHKCTQRISAFLLVRNYILNTLPSPAFVPSLRALYGGSFIDITPSFAFESTTYIDIWDPKKQGNGKKMGGFFADAPELVKPHLTAFSADRLEIEAHNFDYYIATEALLVSYDILLSFDAGLVSQACLALVKGPEKDGGKKGGLLVANDGHGDASVAMSSGNVKLIGVILTQPNSDECILERKPEVLSKYFCAKKKPHAPYTSEQLAANANKPKSKRKHDYLMDDPYAYVFEKQ